jgi:hypothetical protein
MATTYTLISSVTVGSGGAATIEFTSIPGTYTDLKVVYSARSTYPTSVSDQIKIRFNDDSGSNYRYRGLFSADDNNVYVDSSSSATYMYVGWGTTNGATANTFGSSEFYVPNYTSSNQKSVSADRTVENNSSTMINMGFTAGLWTGTSAITKITMYQDSGYNFGQYTTAYLYGISNA